MNKKTEEKAPVKVGFFKRLIAQYRQARKEKESARNAKLLLRLANEFGLSLVKIVRRGGTDYIVTPAGQYRKIGSGQK